MKYDLEPLYALCESSLGNRPLEASALPAAGGDRQYYRLRLGDGCSVIGGRADSAADARAFVSLSEAFAAAGVRVPAIFGATPDFTWYLEEDLGDTSLFSRLTSVEAPELVARTVRELALLNTVPAEAWRDLTAYSPFSRRLVMWDLNYFKYCFFKAAGIEFDELKLEEEFECLVSMLLAYDTPTFMYRDFQSRNVIIDSSGRPGFIDFQGGRRGPYHYDVASFLWQAKARLPQTLREKLIDDYIEASREYCILDPEEFRKELNLFVLFRTLQVLGAYGFRGYVEGKQHFLQSIPDAIANLRELLKCGFPRLPYLSELLRKLTESERFSQPQSALRDGLTVRVNSFGFRKSGIPADTTGNGGGFVFDCRALHNPGRYDQYKQLTGLDQEVIDFLESNSGILSFLGHAYALVDNAVECYLQRGFTDLSVSFGCTGGRHRSVYCAAHMAAHIYEKFGCRVVLSHIEQGIKQIYEPK